MKYVFFGSPAFAAIVLKKLLDAGLPPAAVVCNPDRPVGRKQVITPPPVKVLAQQHNIPVLQPKTIEELTAQSSKLKAYNPDFFIVCAYAKIIPKEIISIPRLGVVGVHPSLLPEYRGTTPIQSVILAGESETGVTLFLIDEKVDHGPTLANREWPIANRATYRELHDQLAGLAGELLVETLPKFISGEIQPVPQDESAATYTKKFSSDDSFVDERDIRLALAGDPEKAAEIDRKVRALTPEPGVWTRSESGRRTKILETDLEETRLVIKKTQVEGKKPKETKQL